jgi:hypothetical protein
MKKTFLAAFLLLASGFAPQAGADVRDTPSERIFSLPAGAPALVIKRGDWTISREQRRPGDTAVYYLISSDSSRLTLSVYIDKSTACQSADACLKMALQNKSYAAAKDEKPVEAGPFKAVAFYIDEPGGAPVKQANIMAEAYVDGHWFDVHISKVGKERPDLAPLVELLQGLTIR